MYSKTHWQDRVVDPETGEVVQEGTFMSAEHFNNMEDGIEANDTAISEISESVETIETTLDTGVGTTITLTVNSSTFVMKLALKNSEGNILSESEVDLPIESMIVNAEYVEATKSLVLTLQSGSKVTVPLSALINGLVNDTRKVAGMDLKKDITVAEMVTALGVDKKANKTEISSDVNSTKSVINVTETNAQMAMIKSVSGKTIRANIFNGYTNMGAYTTTTEKYNGHDCISATGAWNGAYDSSMVLKSGKTYTISAMVKSSNANIKFMIYTFTSTEITNFTITSANTWTKISHTFTPKSDLTNVRIEASASTTATISEFMVTEGEQLIPYCSPSSLASAPVESVVSVGQNRIEKILRQSNIGASGNITSGSTETFDLCIAKVEAGKKYSFSERAIFAYFTSMPSVGSVSYNNSRDTSFNTTIITAPITGYVAARCALNTNFMIVEGTTAPSTYIPPNKTTVLVPQSIRNLPDYGVENNIVDFENGTYTHNNTISNGAVTAYTGTDKVIPISDYLRPLPVESGGTLTLVNEHNLDVNSTIKYKKEV